MDRLVPKNLKTKLRKALTISGGEATPLVPEDLEPSIREYLMYMSPLSDMVPVVEADGHVHKVVRRTALNRGWFEGEDASPSYGESTFERLSVEVKILRAHGKVTDFAVSAARSFTDAWADEIEGAALGFADLMEYSTMWACSDEMDALTGDVYQNPGVYAWVLEDAPSTNIIEANPDAAAGATITLTMLDSMFAATVGRYRNFRRDPYVWLMSQDMVDKVSGLQTRVSRQVNTIEYEGDFTMQTYKGIPILPSGFCAPDGAAAPSNLSASTSSGGNLDASTQYFYRVASITLYGEQVAAAEVNATTDSTNKTIDLSWDADSDAKLYAIYRGETTGDANLQLLDIIPARTYTNGLADGNNTSYADDGSESLVSGEVRPLDSGEETVWLVNLGQRFGVSRPVLTPENGEPMGALLRYEDIPVATDEMAFRLKSYSTIQVPNGKSIAVLRRATAS